MDTKKILLVALCFALAPIVEGEKKQVVKEINPIAIVSRNPAFALFSIHGDLLEILYVVVNMNVISKMAKKVIMISMIILGDNAYAPQQEQKEKTTAREAKPQKDG